VEEETRASPFHGKPDGETTPPVDPFHVKLYGETTMATDRDEGLLIGLLIGEGHFGGDGRQPHVTLRMHTDHEALFRWIERTFPGGRLYGPYHHSGRHYFQWMARGDFLRNELVPLLDRHLTPELDGKAWERFQAMKADYRL
jgi:hypothetical protein